MKWLALLMTILTIFCCVVSAEVPSVEPLRPFAGPTTRGVDCSTLDGKILCGYQGWFNTPGDGSGRGFAHWARLANQPLKDGNVHVDLWPDLSEFDPSELHDTSLKFADGRPAPVFSSSNGATVMRHFRWMRDYGIDGVFVQRFASQLRGERDARNVNTVLDHCRAAANTNGRCYAVMYDLSGLRANEIQLVIDDWRALRSAAKIGDDPAYLHHQGKPLVAVWGVGFNDDRPYTLDDCATLIDFLKADGCAVMVGVPTHWRELDRDAMSDPAVHEVIGRADVVSPWTVGRYDTPDAATRYAEQTLKADVDWAKRRNVGYLPVVFPGFSWHNMRDGEAKLDEIPRLGGQFLWAQLVNVQRAGLRSAYVAMFDELDEGTAIFKLASTRPAVRKSAFVPLRDVPGDQYLRLAGEGGRLLRGERAEAFPAAPVTRP